MELSFTSHLLGPVQLSAVIPEGYNDIRLPGGQFRSWVREFGRILVQELAGEHYIIRYNIFQFLQRLTLRIREDQYGIPSRLVLKNNLIYKSPEVGRLYLRENQYAILHTPSNIFDLNLAKQQEYRMFDTHYSAELVAELIPSFPKLDGFMKKVKTGKPVVLTREKWASPGILDLAYNILQCPYDQNLRRFYFDNKIREYLFLQLVEIYRKEPRSEKLTAREITSVHEAKKIILDDIEQHFTIRHLARKVGLNEFKLKSAFKKIFGLGIFECLLNARMQKARMLLLETDKPIKEIALLAGYEHITNFITAFRKHFNYTPGSLRRTK